jgi:4'-phosphopantetheinyl transferase N-terminal domain
MLDTKPMDAERAPPPGAAASRLTTGDNGFIRKAERLAFPGFPDIAALRCRYCAPAYHDTLFGELGIVFPEQVRQAVRKRKAEYLAGRYLCRILLGERGLPTQVANGSHRQPLWPAGWIGSVTHMYGPAVRRKRVSLICRLFGLASMYPASDWSVCSGPPWISARMRSHYRPGLKWAIWVTSVRMRREDRSSISCHPLADLGGKQNTVLRHRCSLGPVPLFVP